MPKVAVPLDAWREWRQECAMDQCSEKHSSLLAEYGDRCLQHAYRYGEAANTARNRGWSLPDTIPVLMLRPGDGFRALETFICTRKGGRRAFKNTVFQKTEMAGLRQAHMISSYIYQIFQRDLMRKVLRLISIDKDKDAPIENALDETIDDEHDHTNHDKVGSRIGAHELLSYKGNKIRTLLNAIMADYEITPEEKSDFCSAAKIFLDSFLGELNGKDLLSATWKILEIPLTNERIEDLTDMKMQQVSKRANVIFKKMSDDIDQKYSYDDEESRLLLWAFAYECMPAHLMTMSSSNTKLRAIFELAERIGSIP